MGRIILVRHGKTALNGEGPNNVGECIRGWLDVPLDPMGCEEAIGVAREVAKLYKVHSIYTSDLPRTRQTAEIMAEHCRCGIIPDQRLRTWNLMGFQGRRVEEVLSDLKYYEVNPEARPPLGESFSEFVGRVQSVLHDVLHEARKSKYDTALSTHGRVVSVVPHILAGKLDPEPYGTYSKTGALLEIKPVKGGYKLYPLT